MFRMFPVSPSEGSRNVSSRVVLLEICSCHSSFSLNDIFICVFTVRRRQRYMDVTAKIYIGVCHTGDMTGESLTLFDISVIVNV